MNQGVDDGEETHVSFEFGPGVFDVLDRVWVEVGLVRIKLDANQPSRVNRP